MFIEFDAYYLDAIHEKYAWRICDFVTINADRLKRFFPKTLEENLTPNLSKYFVERKIKAFGTKEEFLFVMKEKEDHSVIGLIFLKALDWQKKDAELAYCIGYQYEGKGWTTQAVKAISRHALNELGLKTLRIIVHVSNHASIKVAEKCGYLWKKTLPNEHKPANEDPLDMELFELHA